MEDIKLAWKEDDHGEFYIDEHGERMAEMSFSLKDKTLTVYHTEVQPAHEGKGIATLLLDHMTAFIRKNNYKVVPLCRFVHVQFKKNSEKYKDIWQQ